MGLTTMAPFATRRGIVKSDENAICMIFATVTSIPGFETSKPYVPLSRCPFRIRQTIRTTP